jgi:hypothetical protein
MPSNSTRGGSRTGPGQPMVTGIGGSPKFKGWRSRIRPGLVDSAALAVACLVSYWVVAELLSNIHSVSKADDALGGLWAVIATAFVYRATYRESHTAALTRISATLLSFGLCLVYLALAPFHVWGLAVLVGAGAFFLSLVGRSGDVATYVITTAVVLVVAGLSPHDAWQEPILRLVDTAVGVAIGVAAAWGATHLRPKQTP